jgi:hypothetical protein
MSRTTIPGVQHFCLEELVDPRYLDKFGANAIWFLDRALVLCIDRLREAVGEIVINNWHVGGVFKESGLRWPDTTTGAQFSQHKFKCAFDLKPRRISVEQLYQHITANHAQYPQITTIENPAKTKTWLHVDGRWHAGDSILIVEP